MSQLKYTRDGVQVAQRPNSCPAFDTVEENRQGDRPVQEHHDSTFEVNPLNGTHTPLLSKNIPGFGEPRRKKLIEIADIVAVVVSLVLFAIAFITVSPSTSIPWKLGLTRQFQIIGLLLSAMNQCLLSLAPKIFVLVEARFGHSFLQNYDAILRNSFMRDDTSSVWRGTLSIVTIVPIALSLAYKEFSSGTSHHTIYNDTSHFYGMLPTAGLEDRFVGLTYFANSTMSFTAAIFDDPPLPSFPSAYGYNTLLLSNTSSAILDAPSPEYVRAIQESLITDESYNLTADVYATVTSYNDSVESHRHDDEFWNFYLSQMHDPPNQYLSQPNPSGNDSKDSYLESKLSGQDLYNNQSASVLMNSFFILNTSWMFFTFIPTELELSDVSTHAEIFRQKAMLYHTRRESCTGTWRITYNSIELLSGKCDNPPLPEEHQGVFTNVTLALPQWYMTLLSEYLGRFTKESRKTSPWFMPASCTVFASMYWSRVTSFNVKTLWGDSTTTDGAPSTGRSLPADLGYQVSDIVVSSRRTMNPSLLLYVVLAVFPALTALLFICGLVLRNLPIDSGFGMIALLAGVRKETLQILKGASTSGKLKNPIRVSIVIHDVPAAAKGLHDQRNEYILSEKQNNSAPLSSSNFNDSWFGIPTTVRGRTV